jgi:hypothetical protein
MKASEGASETLQMIQNAHTICLLGYERVGKKALIICPLRIPSREPNHECGILQRHYRMTLKRNESREAHPVPDERLVLVA